MDGTTFFDAYQIKVIPEAKISTKVVKNNHFMIQVYSV